eukprot:scaffold2963_cov250-Pinguiococcus_pyrenoidosus.AAC.3
MDREARARNRERRKQERGAGEVRKRHVCACCRDDAGRIRAGAPACEALRQQANTSGSFTVPTLSLPEASNFDLEKVLREPASCLLSKHEGCLHEYVLRLCALTPPRCFVSEKESPGRQKWTACFLGPTPANLPVGKLADSYCRCEGGERATSTSERDVAWVRRQDSLSDGLPSESRVHEGLRREQGLDGRSCDSRSVKLDHHRVARDLVPLAHEARVGVVVVTSNNDRRPGASAQDSEQALSLLPVPIPSVWTPGYAELSRRFVHDGMNDLRRRLHCFEGMNEVLNLGESDARAVHALRRLPKVRELPLAQDQELGQAPEILPSQLPGFAILSILAERLFREASDPGLSILRLPRGVRMLLQDLEELVGVGIDVGDRRDQAGLRTRRRTRVVARKASESSEVDLDFEVEEVVGVPSAHWHPLVEGLRGRLKAGVVGALVTVARVGDASQEPGVDQLPNRYLHVVGNHVRALELVETGAVLLVVEGAVGAAVVDELVVVPHDVQRCPPQQLLKARVLAAADAPVDDREEVGVAFVDAVCNGNTTGLSGRDEDEAWPGREQLRTSQMDEEVQLLRVGGKFVDMKVPPAERRAAEDGVVQAFDAVARLRQSTGPADRAEAGGALFQWNAVLVPEVAVAVQAASVHLDGVVPDLVRGCVARGARVLPEVRPFATGNGTKEEVAAAAALAVVQRRPHAQASRHRAHRELHIHRVRQLPVGALVIRRHASPQDHGMLACVTRGDPVLKAGQAVRCLDLQDKKRSTLQTRHRWTTEDECVSLDGQETTARVGGGC